MLFVYFGSLFYFKLFYLFPFNFFFLISYFCPVTIVPIVRTFLLAKTNSSYQQINKPINSIISSYQQFFLLHVIEAERFHLITKKKVLKKVI